MFLLYEYDIFWAFFIIPSVIPILAFLFSGILAPSSKGPEKLSSYESGIEPMGMLGYNFESVIICFL
ncbi:NAD(P)H-quinone oxidoreductase subunit 3 chloroplastic [Bienertia sinuspersici]